MNKEHIAVYSYENVCKWVGELLDSPKYIVEYYDYSKQVYLVLKFKNLDDGAIVQLVFDYRYDHDNISVLTIKWDSLYGECEELKQVHLKTINKLISYNHETKCLSYCINNSTIDSAIKTWNEALNRIEQDMKALKTALEADPNYRNILVDMLSLEYTAMQRYLSDKTDKNHFVYTKASDYDIIMRMYAKRNDWMPYDIIHAIESDPFSYTDSCPFTTLNISQATLKQYVNKFAQSCL